MTTMFDTDEQVRKAKAKHETITASHDWDNYYLTDPLDDEYAPADMVGEARNMRADAYDVDFDELREINKSNISSLRATAGSEAIPKKKKMKNKGDL